MTEKERADSALFTMITERACKTGRGMFESSADIRKRYPKPVSAKALTLPSVFALLEMGLTKDEIREVFSDSLEIALMYKTYPKAYE